MEQEGDFIKDLSNKNIIHIKNNGVEYLQFKKLNEYSNIITHCFTLKDLDFKGYDSYIENKEIVTNNYKKICKELDIKYEYICRPKQTHTKNVGIVLQEDIGIYPEKFKDEYNIKLKKAIKSKISGNDIVVKEEKEHSGKIINLMEALQQSLKQSGNKEKKRQLKHEA